MIVGLLALASILGLLISFLFWSWSARRLGTTYGAPGYGHLGYWGAGIMAITVVASYLVLGVLGNTAEGLIAMAACALSGLRCWSAESCTPGRLAVRGNADGNPYGAERCSLVAGGDPVSPMSATPTADDWNASVWPGRPAGDRTPPRPALTAGPRRGRKGSPAARSMDTSLTRAASADDSRRRWIDSEPPDSSC